MSIVYFFFFFNLTKLYINFLIGLVWCGLCFCGCGRCLDGVRLVHCQERFNLIPWKIKKFADSVYASSFHLFFLLQTLPRHTFSFIHVSTFYMVVFGRCSKRKETFRFTLDLMIISVLKTYITGSFYNYILSTYYSRNR